MKKFSIFFVILAFWGCDKDSSSTAPTVDCTALGSTFVEKMDEANDYRRSDDYDSSDSNQKATCDGKCADVVSAAQALLDNACEWPVNEDLESEGFTGAATQEQVDGLESGFCGDYGICN